MKPILFYDRTLSASKVISHRIRSCDETWEQIAPLARLAGVTRVGDITGLDRIGMPVTFAVRPLSRTLTTSSGKGQSLVAAQVSGLMEAFEVFAAEMCPIPSSPLPYRELKERVQVIPEPLLAKRSRSLFHPDLPLHWVTGWDLMGQEEVAAPYVSVSMNLDIRDRSPLELYCFTLYSNGLASGNHLLEAILSGLYETIERDALTCSMAQGGGIEVDLETIPYESARTLLDQLKRADIRVKLVDCTVDTKVPVFSAEVADMRSLSPWKMKGYGAHLDPEVALSRALTEAVQGRAVMIAGSRDDLFDSIFQSIKRSQEKQEESRPMPFRWDRSLASPTLEGDLHLLLERLREVGTQQVIAFDLSRPELNISVVRVIVPGLEGYLNRFYNPMGRASQMKGPRGGFHIPAGTAV